MGSGSSLKCNPPRLWIALVEILVLTGLEFLTLLKQEVKWVHASLRDELVVCLLRSVVVSKP